MSYRVSFLKKLCGMQGESVMQAFRVQGMTCGHCERAVINAIKGLDPDAEVRVDREAGVVEVSTEIAGDQQIRAALHEEGYQVL